MYYLLFLTERCNLACSYCEAPVARDARVQDVRYDLADLVAFLEQDPELYVQFYGGEPLLRMDLIEDLLGKLACRHVCLQTNGLLLDRLPDWLLDKLHVIAVSIDGPRHVTDAYRGEGVYDRVVEQVGKLRARGFRGDIDARMTVSPGVSIYEAVHHLAFECSHLFDSIYWQLNVLFARQDWRQDKRHIKQWFRDSYNPGIDRLVTEWVGELRDGKRLLKIIPFACLTYSLLTKETTAQVRCGAGSLSWTITPQGWIFPCPVLRCSPDYLVGTIRETRPTDLKPLPGLRRACEGCDLLPVCGGRCIYACVTMHWGEEGFRLVCGSTRHLIRRLEEMLPTVHQLIVDGHFSLADYAAVGGDYEVIP